MATSPAKVFEIEDPWDVMDLAYGRGWTDGPPIMPPTEAKVAEFLSYMGGDPQRIIGRIPPKHGTATLEGIATCCAMAGCKPEYMPVVVAAFQAMLEESTSEGGVTGGSAGRWFNLNGVIATANSCGPMLILSGPITKQLGLNSGANAMGGGNRANVAIGRAIRLVIHVIGGGAYGEIDRAEHGGPHKYTSVIADDAEANPWEPIHVTYGLQPEQSGVVVFACNPHNGAWVAPAKGDPARMLRIVADTLSTMGTVNRSAHGYQAVVLSPLVARAIADAGWSKRDVQHFLWENARRPVREFIAQGNLRNQFDEFDPGESAVRARWLDWYNPDGMIPCVAAPENFIVVVCGGDEDWWCAACHGWGELGGWPVVAPISLPGQGGGS